MPSPVALVVVAHPDRSSFNHGLAQALCEVFGDAGLEVRFHDLHAERFDPVLTASEVRGEASADPLVRRHVSDLQAAAVIGVVHPNCWGAPPAIMKGWMDRVFIAGAAYRFPKGDDRGDAPEGMLTASQAIVINTGNTPEERETAMFGDPLERIWADCLFRYCGVGSVVRRHFRVVATSTPETRSNWLTDTRSVAMDAARQVVGRD